MSKSKVAWITGGGTGIGAAYAKILADEGWQVAISGRRTAPLQETASSGGGHIHVYPLDVTDLAATRDTVKSIASDLGAIDLAVLNAGVYKAFKASNYSAETVRHTFEINFMGVVHGIDAVLPAMKKHKSGHIAAVASVAGYRGLPLAADYGASKSAVIYHMESLKMDLDRMGIQTSVVCPGFVETPLTDENKFDMPFIMKVDDAARAMHKGISRGDFEIVFPKKLAYPLKLLQKLPYAVYFPLANRSL